MERISRKKQWTCAAALVSCVTVAATPALSQTSGKMSATTSYYQIEMATKKENGRLALQGHWLLSQPVTLSGKKKPKVPDLPGKVEYILPPCTGALAKYMDEAFGGPSQSQGRIDGNKDWCGRLKQQLDEMGVPYVQHEDIF